MQLRLFISSNISIPPYAPSAAICARCHSGAVNPCAELGPYLGEPSPECLMASVNDSVLLSSYLTI
jgi:hypothetical protein